MVTIPDSVSKRVNFLVRGPPFDPFFSAIMDEMQISVLPKNSEKIIGCQNIFYEYTIQSGLVLAAGLSRPGKSREGPRTGQDGTGPRDPESPGTNKSQDLTSSKVPGLFLKVPGLPGPFL